MSSSHPTVSPSPRALDQRATSPLRLLVHDFSGHPFQAELARSLAARGHQVLHAQCTSYASGKGSFDTNPDGNPQYAAITLDRPFEKYRLRRRTADELRYARQFTRVAKHFEPDVVISCNDPLAAKLYFGVWAAIRRQRWVFWLQDLYSIAMTRELQRRSRFGRHIGSFLQWVERRLLRSAEAVVAITKDFDDTLDAWGIDPSRRTVIENWAPLDEVPIRPRDNSWSATHGLNDQFTFLYAGTLGLKHDPGALGVLAEANPDAEVVVVSEGPGADHLRRLSIDRSLSNLQVLPFQPWEALPDVLATADVLIVLLEPDAGTFSVPSKILTYLCAGRPILASMPPDNLGARTIEGAQAGVVIAPGDHEQFSQAASRLRGAPAERYRMGRSGRAHAERSFDIATITDRFEQLIQRVANGDRTEGNT